MPRYHTGTPIAATSPATTTAPGAAGGPRPRRVPALLVLIVLLATAVFAQDGAQADGSPRVLESLSIADAVSATLTASRDLESARLRTLLAELAVDATLDARRARLSLAADPGYSLATQRGSNFATITSIADFPPEPTTTVSNSLGAGLNLQQALPTGGVLSGGLSTTLSATTSIPETGDASTSFSFRPGLSLALSQPLFVDGSFLDTEKPELVLEQVRRGVLEGELTAEQIRTQLAATTVRIYAQLVSLRGAVRVQLAQRDLLDAQLEQARIRQEQGQGSRQDVFSLQVQINRTSDGILQARLATRELEIELHDLTGLVIDDTTRLDTPADIGAVLSAATNGTSRGVDPDALDGTGSGPGDTVAITPSERLAALAAERARVEVDLARKQERATGRISLSLSPRYADTRESPGTIGGAFSDYVGEGAGVDVSFSLGVTVPLGEDATRARVVEQARIAAELANQDVARRIDERAKTLELIAARRAVLEERLELGEFELEFDREQLASELELREIGVSTALQVEQLRATILGREQQLADLRTQLALLSLDEAVALGVDLATVWGRDRD